MDKELYLDIQEQKNVEHALAYILNGREEKSIKKSLYRRYMHEIEDGKFDTLAPYIICQVFTDPNHICKLLDNHNLVFTYNDSLNIQNEALLHIGLIGFSKEYFSEKTLANMFKRTHRDISLREDSVSMYSTLVETEYLLEHFQKPKANVVAIHNALIRAGHYAEYSPEELDFSYTKDIKKCCVFWHNRLEIRLPQTSFDLMDWSKILDNCLYGYIYLVFSIKQLPYLVYL